jgi:hypothetical protein
MKNINSRLKQTCCWSLLKQSFFQLLLLTMVLTVAVSSILAQNSNWAQWRGNEGSGISAESNLPTEWSDSKNIKWKTEITGRGHSSPIVWGNRVFLTTSIEGPVVPGAEAVRHVHKGQE